MKIKKTCPNDYEHQYWPLEQLVVGIDEAGRGPLAGPLTVAGVIFPIGYENPDIYDSKALSEKKREELFQTIQEDALWFEIIQVEPEEIDKHNIYRADQIVMEQIAKDSMAPVVLTDAMPLLIDDKKIIPLIKGDQKSISIAAASILAKVTRDHTMLAYDKEYPEYGFAKHKGYPTKQHLEALHTYGVTKIHRKSFGPVREEYMKIKLF
ncbi:MAG: ribonuclease HII [Erysipelotrichaceae bacterium]|nr:ribonuclease HII [Erysipelotrichaceae bacterium]MDY6035643.1 ribonuclease HII [Bulleidia sp.]